MNTYFAIPERVTDSELAEEIAFVSQSPLISGLLHSVGGLLAVLDSHRQVVALNETFLDMLGLDHPEQTLGLRLGEVMHCVHSGEEPAGCGTTKACASCGAAISIVSCLGQDKPVERICSLKAKRGGRQVDIALLVRSHGICVHNRRILLVFIQDITQQQQWAALERTFFHDVNNMLSLLLTASELLVEETPSELARTIHQASLRLTKEVAIQRCLAESETASYQPNMCLVEVGQALKELQSFFGSHPVARGKSVVCDDSNAGLSVTTDITLLLRVLCNMVINALEATEPQGAVKVWAEGEAGRVTFCVWNAQPIPEAVALRIFQRNFSTKQQAGRGVGTFSMKLLGEKFLGGSVTFTSSPEKGTVFRLSLPR